MEEGYRKPLIGTFGCVSLGYLIFKLFKSKPYERIFSAGLPFPHQLMSHRGGSREFVENTMPAFRHSAKLGVDLLELDVQLTRDGQVVIFHDNTLQRMCGVPKTIADFNYNELPDIIIPPDLLSREQVKNDPESKKIPLFSKLLEEFPNYPMQIDVKKGRDDLILQVGNLIKHYKRENVTVWGSFVPSSNNICFKHFGTSIPLFFDASRCFKAYFLYKIGLLSCMSFRESALIMPNFGFLMNSKWLKALNDRGVSIIVFGSDGKGALNSPDLWHQARLAGANGICSDKPTELQKWLLEHPLKSVK